MNMSSYLTPHDPHSFFHSHSLVSLCLRVCHLSGGSFVTASWASFLTPLSSPPFHPSTLCPPALVIGQLQGFVCDTCVAGRCAPPNTPKPLYYTKTTLTEPPSCSAGPLSLCGRGSPLLSNRLTQVPPFSPVPPPHAGPKVFKSPEAENEEAIYTAGLRTGSKKREEKDNER